MAFLTGLEIIPVLGPPPQITVTFRHKCLPIVSTCWLTLDIQVHIHNEKAMLEVLERA